MENDGLPNNDPHYRVIELEKESEFFRQIADNSYDWEIFTDKNGKILYVNRAFERITGYTMEDLLSGEISEKDVVHPDDLDLLRSNIGKVINQQVVEDVNYRIVRKDGEIRFVNLYAVPVFKNNEFIGSRATVRDLTLQKNFSELKASREKSEAASKQFKDFFDNAPDAILIIDIDSGIILNSNASASKLLQLPGDKLIGNSISQFQPSCNEELLRKHASESDQFIPLETELFSHVGSKVPIEVLVSEVTFDGRLCLMEVLRDITLRKQNEENLRIALHNVEFHIENSPFAVIDFNNNFQVTKWSAKAQKLFGWRSEEIIGKSIQEFRWVHEEDADRVASLMSNLIASGKTSNVNVNKNYRKDGTIITCEWNNSVLTDAQGELLSVHTLVRDITERDEYEKKLAHSHRLMQYVIEHDRSAIALVDRDMRYVFVSEKFIKDYNIEDNDIIGKSHYEVFPDIPERWKEIHRRTMKGEITSAENDPFKREDGSVVWVRWECRPWYEAENIIGGIILYTEVITAQKESEIELIKAKEKAEESDRLKTAFLQNMSHEVRTPLNSIVGFSQLLSEPGQTPSEIKTFSEIILESSDKLIRIITDVIEISKIQAKQTGLDLSRFDVVQTLTGIVKEYKEVAHRKKISLILKQDIESEKSFIISDISKLEKILTHLIDNAIKFTHQGSVEITSKIEKGNLHFSVTDTGIGIPDELQRSIFEPFRQLESRISIDYGGNGLGLAIVKAYVELLHGSLYLKSEKTQGTKFSISIPISKTEVKTPDDVTVKTTPEPHEENVVKTVLIAEDEYGNYRYLYELLHSDTLRILHAINGREAIEICKNNDEISLVLMDIKMPLMDGKSAAKAIREFRPNLPIIAQTAYALESERSNYLKIFDDLIAKPIKRSELKQKMEKYIPA